MLNICGSDEVLKLQKKLVFTEKWRYPKGQRKRSVTWFQEKVPCVAMLQNQHELQWRHMKIVDHHHHTFQSVTVKEKHHSLYHASVEHKAVLGITIYLLLPLWAAFHLPKLRSNASSTNREVKHPLYLPVKLPVCLWQKTFQLPDIQSLKCSSAVKPSALPMILSKREKETKQCSVELCVMNISVLYLNAVLYRGTVCTLLSLYLEN